MYCGDETGSFVGDVGSHTCRFGYGGDDSPTTVFPSMMYSSDGSIPLTLNKLPRHYQQQNSTVVENDLIPIYQSFPYLNNSSDCHLNEYRIRDGILNSLDAWENAWYHAFDQLHVWDTRKHTSHGDGGGIHSGGDTTTTSSRHVRWKLQKGKHTSSSVTLNRSSAAAARSEGTISHPLLAIDSGLNLMTRPEHSQQDTSTEDNMNTLSSVGKGFQDSITRKQRCGMLEILFESLHAPAAFLAPTPMVASFAHGRQTSLIVDIGAMGMRVTPIVDGFLLKSAQRRTGRGGEWLAHVQYCALEQYYNHHHHYPTMKNKSTFSLHPRYMTMSTTHNNNNNNNNNNNWTQTYFHQMAQRQVLYEMKTSAHILPLSLYRDEDWTVPFASYSTIIHNSNNTPTTSSSSSSTSPSTGTNNNNNNNNGGPSYSLPDGTSIQLHESSMGYDFCRLPEVFFVPSSLLSSLPPFSSSSSSSTSSVHQQQDDLSSFLSIQELIHNSLSAVLDIDIRKELMNNIILTGSSSMYTHMEQRLSYELSTLFPYTYKNKILSSRDGIERQFAPWIGASILSSLGSFQQLWLSQKEYNEYGALLSLQRFP